MNQTKSPRPRRRWLRRLVLLIAVAVTAALVLPGALADNLLREQVEGLLSRQLGTAVTVSGLSFGWWSPVEAEAIVIKDPEGDRSLIEAGSLELDAGMWGLLFGGEVLRVTLRDVDLSLRELSDGRLNVLALAEEMALQRGGGSGDGPGLPERGVELRVASGTVCLADTVVYEVEGGLSCDALDRDPLRFQVGLVRSLGGRVDIGGSLADWNATGGSPSVTGTVEAQGLDLSTLAVVLGPVADLQADGIVERLLVASEPRRGGSRLMVEAQIDDLVVTPRGQGPGQPFDRVSIILSAVRGERSINGVRGSIVVPQGQVTLDPESQIAWDDRGVEGRVKVDGQVEDLEGVRSALSGLLPPGLEVTGGAAVAGHVAGRWDWAGTTPWKERLEAVDAAFDVTVHGLILDGVAARQITAKGAVSGGQITIDRGSASIGGGEVSVKGSLAVTNTSGDSRIDWTIAPAVTVGTSFESVGEVVMGFGGSGTIAMDGGSIRLGGDVDLGTLSAPDFPGMPLYLRNGTLQFGMLVDPDRGALDVERVHLRDQHLDVRIEALRLRSHGAVRRCDGSITATARPGFLHRAISDVRFVDAVTVTGEVTAELADVWPTCGLDLDVVAGRLSWAGHDVTRIAAHIDKRRESVTVSALQCDVDGGRIRGGGALHSDGLRAGDEVKLTIDGVSLTEPLAEGAWRVAGEVSGAVTARGGSDVSSAVFELRVKDMDLRARAEVEASMSALDVSGEVRRRADGTLRFRRLRARGDGVDATVEQLIVPPPGSAARAALAATIDADAAWISATLAPWIPRDLKLSEPVHLEVSGEGSLNAFADTARGTMTLRVPGATIARRPITELVLVAEANKGRVEVTDGRARINDGTVTLGGVFGVAPERRRPGDTLVLMADRLPLTIDEELEPLVGNRRRISTTGVLSGEVKVAADARLALRWDVDLDARYLARHLVIGSSAPSTKTFPDLTVMARGSWSDADQGVVRIDEMSVSGEGVACDLTELVSAPERLVVKRARVSLPASIVHGFSFGVDPDPMFQVTGTVSGFVEGLSATRDADGAVALGSLMGRGQVAVDSCTVAGLSGEQLRCQYLIRGGVVELREGRMDLSGGAVEVLAGTHLGLDGEARPFRLRAKASGVKLRQGVRTRLAILNPLLLARPETDDVTIGGTLDLRIDCGGTWSQAAGWSETVNGSGAIALSGVNVRGSALLLDLAAQGDRLLGGTAAKVVFDVLGERGVIGKFLRPLSTAGLALQDLRSELEVRRGRVRLARGIRMASSDLVLTIDGWGSLEGDVNYRVGTDIVARLKRRAMKELSGKGGVIGQFFGFVNVLGGIGDIELGADVVGNVFDGMPEITVNLLGSSRR